MVSVTSAYAAHPVGTRHAEQRPGAGDVLEIHRARNNRLETFGSARPLRREMRAEARQGEAGVGIIGIVVVGFVAGIIARFLSPGPNKPTGFVLTVVLGIAGAFLAALIGQAVGLCDRPYQGAGFVMATIGAVAVLFDPGTGSRCAEPFPI